MCQALVTPGCMSEWLHWPKCSKNPSVSRITSRKKPRSSVCVTSSLSTTPSMGLMGSTSSLVIRTVRAHEVVDGVVGIDGLPGVAPEAFEHVVLHETFLDVPVVDVGDLELAPARRLQVGQHVPDRFVIEVRAGDGELARWNLWLLHDALDAAAAVELRHAQMPEVLGIALVRQDDARSGRLPVKRFHAAF